MIAKQCKLYTIGETFIKPCASKMVGIVLGEESKRNCSKFLFQAIFYSGELSNCLTIYCKRAVNWRNKKFTIRIILNST